MHLQRLATRRQPHPTEGRSAPPATWVDSHPSLLKLPSIGYATDSGLEILRYGLFKLSRLHLLMAMRLFDFQSSKSAMVEHFGNMLSYPGGQASKACYYHVDIYLRCLGLHGQCVNVQIFECLDAECRTNIVTRDWKLALDAQSSGH